MQLVVARKGVDHRFSIFACPATRPVGRSTPRIGKVGRSSVLPAIDDLGHVHDMHATPTSMSLNSLERSSVRS